MVWRVWHFIALVLVALLLGTTFGHALEMPMKMNADGRLWMTFQHTLYSYSRVHRSAYRDRSHYFRRGYCRFSRGIVHGLFIFWC